VRQLADSMNGSNEPNAAARLTLALTLTGQ
jgi:hypothetical protein